MIYEVESEWRATGIICPFCEGDYEAYSDGSNRPECGNCCEDMPDEYIWQWLISTPKGQKVLTKHWREKIKAERVARP